MPAGKVPAILLLLLCLFPAVLADQLAVSIGDATAAPGSTVTVPVSVSGAQNLGSLDIAIAYDPGVLTVVSVDEGSLGNGLFVSNTDRPGVATVSIADPSGINGNGPVANLKFTVNGAAGTSSKLTITNMLAYDLKTHQAISADSSDGSVTVKKSGLGSPGFGLAAAAGALALLGLLRTFGKS